MKRRAVLRGLVAAGGTSALAACVDLQGNPDIPHGDPTNRPARQHAWNDLLTTDEHGNPLLPEQHVFLSISYDGDDREGDRSVLEDALTDLETAYEASNEGLLFTVGYSPAYFERFDDPIEADVPRPQRLVASENIATDESDIFIHLASDHPSVVLEVREALFGDHDANGVEITNLAGLFSLENRRSGFIGPGLPADRGNLLGIPENGVDSDAPTFMGFRAGFKQNQATENRVTLQDGRFAGGTTQHVERLRHVLDEWVDRPLSGQVARLFSSELDPDDVGDMGEKLTDHNGVETINFDELRRRAEEHGVVGHAEKLSQFREDGRPPIIRRDVNSADNGEAATLFIGLQREFSDYKKLRLAMEGETLVEDGVVGERRENGILQYIRTRERANFLIPPRELRALP